MKAKYIITYSFHGCFFYNFCNKPLIIYGNNSRGLTRFDSLLETFNLKSRFITNSLDSRQKVTTENISFDKTNEIISQYRKDANTFFEEVNI